MRIKKFNESSDTECSFEEFKDIMTDITDDLSMDYEFKDFSKGDGSYFYDLQIKLPMVNNNDNGDIGDIILGYDFISYRAHDGISSYNGETDTFSATDIRRWITMISDQNTKISSIKSEIDKQVSYNLMVKSILVKLPSITKRFKSFSNFRNSEIGIGYDQLRITFEISSEEDEN
jgi:hypothetical protein